MSSNDYTYWRETLAGKRVPMYEGEPQPGWYKYRFSKDAAWVPLVIWRASDGKIYARCWVVNDVTPNKVWMQAARFPLSVNDYNNLVAGLEPPALDPNEVEPVI